MSVSSTNFPDDSIAKSIGYVQRSAVDTYSQETRSQDYYRIVQENASNQLQQALARKFLTPIIPKDDDPQCIRNYVIQANVLFDQQNQVNQQIASNLLDQARASGDIDWTRLAKYAYGLYIDGGQIGPSISQVRGGTWMEYNFQASSCDGRGTNGTCCYSAGSETIKCCQQGFRVACSSGGGCLNKCGDIGDGNIRNNRKLQVNWQQNAINNDVNTLTSRRNDLATYRPPTVNYELTFACIDCRQYNNVSGNGTFKDIAQTNIQNCSIAIEQSESTSTTFGPTTTENGQTTSPNPISPESPGQLKDKSTQNAIISVSVVISVFVIFALLFFLL